MSDEHSINFKVTANDKEAQKKLANLRKDMEKTAQTFDKASSQHNVIAEKLQRAREEAQKTAKEIQRTKDMISEAEQITSFSNRGKSNPAEFVSAVRNKGSLSQQLKEQQDAYKRQNEQVASLEEKEREILATLQKQRDLLAQQKSDAGAVERQIAQQASGAMPQLKAAAEAASASVRSGVKSILKWGLGIKAALGLVKKLKNYIREAVHAFAEQDSETRNNINNLKSALNTLKLSWGAAFAPILNAVAPLLQRLIGWLTTAANAVNMFFSALAGKSTYKKVSAGLDSVSSSAGEVAEAEDEIAESAEEAKKQLMGFDEINKLDDTSDSSKSSRGGAGGAAGAGLAESEEAMISPKMMAFVDWLKKHLEDIKILAGAIATALLGWKISKMLGTDIQKTIGVLLTIYGVALMVHGAFDAWQNGLNWDNLKMILEGIAIAALGAYMAVGPLGLAMTLLIGGITLLILGLKDLITTGELTNENFAALAIGIGLVGAAIAIITGSWIPLLIAAITVLVLWIIQHWEEIKEKTIEIWEALGEWLSEKWDFIKEIALEYFGAMWEGIKRIWDGIRQVFEGIIDFVVGVFTGDWQRAWDGVVQIFSGICDQIGGIVDTIIGLVDGIISAVQDAIAWVGRLNDTANANAQWNEQSGALFATDPSQVNWHAKGGIVKRASIIGAGEAGREAVLPLDRNTGWIRDLAGQILGRMDSMLPPMPAMAMGQVVPPNAHQGGGISEADVARIIAAIQGIGSGSGGSGTHTTVFNLNGREFARAIYDDQKAVEKEHGVSLIVNG